MFVKSFPGRRCVSNRPSVHLMLTNKGKYGLKALVHLAQLPQGQLALVNEIAPPTTSRKSSSTPSWANCAMPASCRAARARAAAIGWRVCPRISGSARWSGCSTGRWRPYPCASRTRYEPCDDCDVTTCQVRHIMLDVREAIAEVLDHRTLAEMRDLGDIDALPEAAAVL